MITTSPLGPTIETKRLILRPPLAEDFEGFAKMNTEEETMRFIGGVQSKPVSWRSFNQIAGAWALYGFAMFSVLEKETGAWIGRIGPIHPLGWPDYEIGWGVTGSAMGKGYAPEAAAATIDWAIQNLGWNHFIHCIAPENHASIRVAQKLGSKNLGPTKLPAPWENINVDAWGQTATEWQMNRKNLDYML